jgi:hypothetical protein
MRKKTDCDPRARPKMLALDPEHVRVNMRAECSTSGSAGPWSL